MILNYIDMDLLSSRSFVILRGLRGVLINPRVSCAK